MKCVRPAPRVLHLERDLVDAEADPGDEPAEEPVLLLERVDLVDDLAVEELVVGLAVHLPADGAADQQVEESREALVGDALAAAVALHGVHHVGAVAPALDKRGEQARGVLQIAVHDDDRVTARDAQAGRERALLPEVPRKMDGLDPGARLRELPELVARAVRRPVVDEHDLEARPETAEHLVELVDQRKQDLRLVVERHDHGDLG